MLILGARRLQALQRKYCAVDWGWKARCCVAGVTLDLVRTNIEIALQFYDTESDAVKVKTVGDATSWGVDGHTGKDVCHFGGVET